MKTSENLNRECGLTRRGFVAACGALAASAVHGDEAVPQDSAASVPREQDPFLGTQGVPLAVGAPCLQAPILERAGVQLVVCGHQHRFRFDEPTASRRWAQVVGGGPELGVAKGKPDASRFPTVVEGLVEGGKLRLVVHDVFNNCIVLDKYL